MRTLLLFVLVVKSSVFCQDLIEPLPDNQALRFEEIGQLKLINKYITLSFHVNVSSLRELIKNSTEYLTEIEKLFENEPKQKNEIEILRTNLYIREIELQDILYGTIQMKPKKQSNTRQKRQIFGFSSDDKQQISNNLKSIQERINGIIFNQDAFLENARQVTQHLNKTIEEHSKKVALDFAKMVDTNLDKKVSSIIKALTAEKLNGDIITITEFTDMIKNIRDNLTEYEQLPYQKVAEYYYNIRINQKVDGVIIKLEMSLPIIEKSSWSLYKITELPALNERKLYVIDAQMNFIANRTQNETIQYMAITTLDTCYKPTSTMFYCENEAPIKSISNSPSCASSALMGGNINVKNCRVTVMVIPHLTFIRLSDGQYFYYTPRNEKLDIICMSVIETVYLIENTVGILNIKSGCRAVSHEYILIKTVRYQQAPYVKQHVLNVSLDIDEVKENMEKFGAPMPDNYYLESMSALREMSIRTKKIDNLEIVPIKAGPIGVLQYLLIVLLAVFIIFVLYKIFIWSLQYCKCLRNNEKRSTKI